MERERSERDGEGQDRDHLPSPTAPTSVLDDGPPEDDEGAILLGAEI